MPTHQPLPLLPQPVPSSDSSPVPKLRIVFRPPSDRALVSATPPTLPPASVEPEPTLNRPLTSSSESESAPAAGTSSNVPEPLPKLRIPIGIKSSAKEHSSKKRRRSRDTHGKRSKKKRVRPPKVATALVALAPTLSSDDKEKLKPASSSIGFLQSDISFKRQTLKSEPSESSAGPLLVNVTTPEEPSGLEPQTPTSLTGALSPGTHMSLRRQPRLNAALLLGLGARRLLAPEKDNEEEKKKKERDAETARERDTSSSSTVKPVKTEKRERVRDRERDRERNRERRRLRELRRARDRERQRQRQLHRQLEREREQELQLERELVREREPPPSPCSSSLSSSVPLAQLVQFQPPAPPALVEPHSNLCSAARAALATHSDATPASVVSRRSHETHKSTSSASSSTSSSSSARGQTSDSHRSRHSEQLISDGQSVNPAPDSEACARSVTPDSSSRVAPSSASSHSHSTAPPTRRLARGPGRSLRPQASLKRGTQTQTQNTRCTESSLDTLSGAVCEAPQLTASVEDTSVSMTEKGARSEPRSATRYEQRPSTPTQAITPAATEMAASAPAEGTPPAAAGVSARPASPTPPPPLAPTLPVAQVAATRASPSRHSSLQAVTAVASCAESAPACAGPSTRPCTPLKTSEPPSTASPAPAPAPAAVAAQNPAPAAASSASSVAASPAISSPSVSQASLSTLDSMLTPRRGRGRKPVVKSLYNCLWFLFKIVQRYELTSY